MIEKEDVVNFGFLISGIIPDELVIAKRLKKSGVSLNDLVLNQRGAIIQKFA